MAPTDFATKEVVCFLLDNLAARHFTVKLVLHN